MADRKITELTAMSAGTQATGDLLTIVDVSEAAAVDKNKKITVESLFKGIPSNVGIGTTSPHSALHLHQGTSSGTQMLFTNSTTSSSNGRGFQVGLGADEQGQFWLFENKFIRFATNNTERLRIDSSGNLMMGTSSSPYVLTADELNLSVGNATDHATIQLYSGTNKWGAISFNDNATNASNAGLIGYYHPDNYMVFNTNSAERMRINSSGNVGIGTSSPSAVVSGSSLTVAGSIHSEINFVSSSAGVGALYFGDTTSGAQRYAGYLEYNHSIDSLRFGTGTIERLRIDSAGRITAVGTSGSARVIPLTDNVGYLGQAGNRWQAVYAVNGTIQTSDSRQKTEITGSNLGYEFIKSLRPVSYKWIDGGNNASYNEEGELVYTKVPGKRNHYGFIAQEVKEALGSTDFGGWVVEDVNDAESAQSLRYSEFIAPLTKALQEAMAKIETLEQRLSDAGIA